VPGSFVMGPMAAFSLPIAAKRAIRLVRLSPPLTPLSRSRSLREPDIELPPLHLSPAATAVPVSVPAHGNAVGVVSSSGRHPSPTRSRVTHQSGRDRRPSHIKRVWDVETTVASASNRRDSASHASRA
jgi:hypothetical protein